MRCALDYSPTAGPRIILPASPKQLVLQALAGRSGEAEVVGGIWLLGKRSDSQGQNLPAVLLRWPPAGDVTVVPSLPAPRDRVTPSRNSLAPTSEEMRLPLYRAELLPGTPAFLRTTVRPRDWAIAVACTKVVPSPQHCRKGRQPYCAHHALTFLNIPTPIITPCFAPWTTCCRIRGPYGEAAR